MDNMNNKPSRLDIYCAGGLDAFMAKSALMKNSIKVTEDQAKSAQNTISILMSRHNYLSQIEEYVANSSVLLPYYAQAEEEVTRANNFSMATIFITALEKISEVLLEYEQSTGRETPDEELVRLRKENKELNEKLDEIAEIFRKYDTKYAK